MGKHANLERSNLNKHQKKTVQVSRNSNDLGYFDKINHQIKLNKDAQPFRRSYCSMSYDKRKAMIKTVEDLEDAKIVEPTHSYLASSSILLRKDGSYRQHVDYRGLNKQIEKNSWPLTRTNDVIDSLDGNC